MLDLAVKTSRSNSAPIHFSKCVIYNQYFEWLCLSRAASFKIVNIEIKAWFNLLINLKITLIINFYLETCTKFNQRLEKPEQLIRSREFWHVINERTLIGWNNVVISKKRKKEQIKQISKVSTVDIQIKWSGLKLSNSTVFRWYHIKKDRYSCKVAKLF